MFSSLHRILSPQIKITIIFRRSCHTRPWCSKLASGEWLNETEIEEAQQDIHNAQRNISQASLTFGLKHPRVFQEIDTYLNHPSFVVEAVRRTSLFEESNLRFEMVSRLAYQQSAKVNLYNDLMTILSVQQPKRRDITKHKIFTAHQVALEHLMVMLLDPIIDVWSDPNSYGERKGRTVHQAIGRLSNALQRDASNVHVLKIEINKDKNQIPNEWILKHFPISERLNDMFELFLRQQIKVERKELNLKVESEIPHKGQLASLIKSFAFDGFEEKLNDLVNQTNLNVESNKKYDCPIRLCVVRHDYEIAIVCRSYAFVQDEVIPFVAHFLKDIGLKLDRNETQIISLTTEEPFSFAGLW